LIVEIEKLNKILQSKDVPIISDNTDRGNNTNMPSDKTKNTIATWNILFYPDDELIKRAVNLVYTFNDLFLLGEYTIENCTDKSKDKPFWNIFLVTNHPYDEIEGALMFVLDNCKIIKVADFNILEPSCPEKRNNRLDQSLDKMIQSMQDKADEINSESKLQTHSTSSTTQQMTASVDLRTQEVISQQVYNKSKTTRINIESTKLDRLMYLVSELVTTKSELILALQKQNIEKAIDTSEKIEKLSKLFSDIALNIRLVSLHELLSRFKRLIRDLSKQLNKSIHFETIGEETELDKNIIDNLGEPIMHLIRNCIDHGIEPSDKRKEIGKPETGIIKFEARKSGNYVYINISDDGNGINSEYVYNKAVEKGYIAKGTELSQKGIFDLIFLPGFSTAQSLTDVSGRGVGMDIVLKKIQEIRGEINVTSTTGIGTTFSLKLQQSISIIETLLISAGGFTYAIPIEDIESCIIEDVKNIKNKQNQQIGYNNNLIPFINLCTKFSINNHENDLLTEKLIIINRINKVYAIVADNIIGEYQAVIKPLGNAFASLKFLSGASVLGDGSIALLLDTDKLWSEISSN
jgi:two-component system chemotaxis sensor kinase CheA